MKYLKPSNLIDKTPFYKSYLSKIYKMLEKKEESNNVKQEDMDQMHDVKQEKKKKIISN